MKSEKGIIKLHVLFLTFCASLLLLCVYCENSGTQQQNDADTLDITSLEELPEVIEVRGVVGDGSSMNMLELVTPEYDTLNIEISNSLIAGSIAAGDDIDVIYSKVDNDLVSSIAINITALQHLWTQRSSQGQLQSLEINPDGFAETYNMNGINYDRWSVKDGQLLLHASQKAGVEGSGYTDTFDILMLTADTLVLGASDSQTRFWRDN